ncbi:uncharacterized protein LOC144454317 [Phascolarctos cinereus]
MYREEACTAFKQVRFGAFLYFLTARTEQQRGKPSDDKDWVLLLLLLFFQLIHSCPPTVFEGLEDLRTLIIAMTNHDSRGLSDDEVCYPTLNTGTWIDFFKLLGAASKIKPQMV